MNETVFDVTLNCFNRTLMNLTSFHYQREVQAHFKHLRIASKDFNMSIHLEDKCCTVISYLAKHGESEQKYSWKLS